MESSLTFGLFADEERVGFPRVGTDRATFAYLADVFVLEPHRAGEAPGYTSSELRFRALLADGTREVRFEQVTAS